MPNNEGQQGTQTSEIDLSEVLQKLQAIEDQIKGIPASEIPTIKSVVDDMRANLPVKEEAKDNGKKYEY